MKKTLLFVIVILSFILTGCCEMKMDSLEEYKYYISESKIGYSSKELDHPDYFLPTHSFLNDYEYIVGEYHYYEHNPFCEIFTDKLPPDRTLIVLKYSESTYQEAKECVLNNIPKYDDYYYIYNDYQFYINKNFMDRFDENSYPQIPNWLTMVCYNDDNYVICFLGFSNSYPKLDEKYLTDLENNWQSFIEQYYGEYYDFSK